MSAESPKAPESKARMAWFLDNRHQAFLADRDGTGGCYDPIEAPAPADPETPPHRRTRHTEHVYAPETGIEGVMRVVPTSTNWSRRFPVRAAKRGGVETRHRDAEKKTGYVSRSYPRRSTPVDRMSIEGLGRGGKR